MTATCIEPSQRRRIPPKRVEPITSDARLEWVDCARGIGIVLVVFGHVWNGLAPIAPSRIATPLWIAYTAVYSFHMPLFFLLSGMFVERSARQPAGSFLLSKVRTILYPYVVWSILQAAISSWADGMANHPASLLGVIRDLPVRPWAQFWFLYVLFMCLVAFALLYKLRLGPVVALIAVGFYSASPYIRLPNWGPLFEFRANFVYFCAGALLGPWLVKPMLVRAGALWLIAAAALPWTIVGIAAAAEPRALHMNEVTLLAGLGIFASIAAAVLLSRMPGAGAVALLGRKSLPIYVAHVIFAAATRALLLNARVTDIPIHLMAGITAGLLLPILLEWGARRARIDVLFSIQPPDAHLPETLNIRPPLCHEPASSTNVEMQSSSGRADARLSTARNTAASHPQNSRPDVPGAPGLRAALPLPTAEMPRIWQ